MAVEANETVGGADADIAASDTSEAATAVSSAAVASAIADQEPHPVFDANSYHQPLEKPKQKTSLMMIIIIVIILALVGASIGVLYFLYGQQ